MEKSDDFSWILYGDTNILIGGIQYSNPSIGNIIVQMFLASGVIIILQQPIFKPSGIS